MQWGFISRCDIRTGRPNRLYLNPPKGKDPQVDRRPARSLGRAYLQLENIKEGLDMIEEYVISR